MRIKKPLPAIAAAVKLTFLSVVANFYVLPFLLPHQDSNLDKQNQNLSYYHYTMGQHSFGMAKLGFFSLLQKKLLTFFILTESIT